MSLLAKWDTWRRKPTSRQYAVYGLLAAALLGPLLLPGYILTMDMVFTPELRWPEHLNNLAVFFAALHLINIVLPSDVVQKLLLFITFTLAGVGAHRLLVLWWPPVKARVGSDSLIYYLAGLLYVVNPFVYSRFMAGQYLVLLGYALLPFLLRYMWQLLLRPSVRAALKVGGVASLMAVVSIHSVGFTVLAGAVFGSWQLWRLRTKRGQLVQLVKAASLAAGVFVATSAYWLIPLLLGRGSTAQTIAQYQAGDFEAFATVGATVVDKMVNIMALHGFWQEARELYAIPQETSWWGIVLLALWGLAIYGGGQLWRRQPVAMPLYMVVLVAVVVAAGALSPNIASQLPFVAGFREPHKLVAFVALVFALLVPIGVGRLRARLQSYPTIQALITGMVVAAALLFAPQMWWGFGGQLQTSQYPADWQRANQILVQDNDQFQTLFLPWHLYMHFDFAGRIIANPAERYFATPVIVSDNPELEGVSPDEADARTAAIDQKVLPFAPTTTRLGEWLRPYGVKYILLAKEVDYHKYSHLQRQTDLEVVLDTPSLTVYRNTAFKQGE